MTDLEIFDFRMKKCSHPKSHPKTHPYFELRKLFHAGLERFSIFERKKIQILDDDLFLNLERFITWDLKNFRFSKGKKFTS